MSDTPATLRRRAVLRLAATLAAVAVAVGLLGYSGRLPLIGRKAPLNYQPRRDLDPSGFMLIVNGGRPWKATASLEEVATHWQRAGYRRIDELDKFLSLGEEPQYVIEALLTKAALLHYEGDPSQAYQVLRQARERAESDRRSAEQWLYTIIYLQGVTALRQGETDNCVLCRGESSCILPITSAAVHTVPDGSSRAISHFLEYLDRFPDDLEVRWLLNVAHMTLGEHPQTVYQPFLVPLDHYLKSEFDLGRFRDIGALVGLNRFNQAGGAIMEDFDNDGRLDVVVTSMDPTQPVAFYRNKGDGNFEERTESAGLTKQLGGLYCVQADYDNDGHADIFIPRGAWLRHPIRPSLLHNNGDGTFVDVTLRSGLIEAVNSISAAWADYDNDGRLDLFVCCERQPNRLYRNRGDGTFDEVSAKAGVAGTGEVCKGAAWIDYDNDGDPDLFLNHLSATARLHRNNGDGTFADVTKELGVDGPYHGFSCWAWDYDNDGWLDLFATCYDRTVADVVKGLLGQPHARNSNKLYRNLRGKGFQDVTKAAGLDLVFATMGSNYGDFDNDGYLDFYLGTGEPSLAALVPNRMFKNVAGKRFAEVTAATGTGHLQKGHAVACGDWDRDGDVDVFIEMGGAVNGDRYHNVLFQNPGHGNNSLTVKLVGQKSNRSAIGARIKAVTAGESPLTVCRHVSTGSSFGANPLQHTLGLGKADRVAVLEVYWPTSGTTQTFRDVAANQAIEITELAGDYRKLDGKPIPLPK